MKHTPYPLDWPADWPRTTRPERSRFGRSSFNKARKILLDELRKLHAQEIVLSTNRALKLNGDPYSSHREPEDSGVAVYFYWNGRPHTMACDTYHHDWENMKAIAASVSAMRTMSRHGASPLLERAMGGFAALPEEGHSTNKFVEVFESCEDGEEARKLRRKLLGDHHPDRGGSAEEIIMINAAFDHCWVLEE